MPPFNRSFHLQAADFGFAGFRLGFVCVQGSLISGFLKLVLEFTMYRNL